MYLINTTGRRKTSAARIFIKKGKGIITINSKTIEDYFKMERLVQKVKKPLLVTELEKKYDMLITVKGGGYNGQADAVALGIARGIVSLDETKKPALKEFKLLTRDPRMVERKKPGKKKARKGFQFSKR